LPEAAGIEPWSFPVRANQRLFYSVLSPIALFWPIVGEDQPLRFVQPSDPVSPIVLKLPTSGASSVRGFAPHPFLPVLVESRSGGSWLGWTNDASEYEVGGLPAGSFRVRALDLFGTVTFASGASVHDGLTISPERLWAKVDLQEPESREVMGFVRWENGAPAARAVVFMQNTYDFRKFVRRVVADEHGFFRFAGVAGDEPYFVFALPPGEEGAIRLFEYFGAASYQREIWRSLALHPHKVVGSLPDGLPTETLLQLVRIDGNAERSPWSFRAGVDGRFTIANVPDGLYRVQAPPRQGGGQGVARSAPFAVGDGRPETTLRWSAP
jgi:hypothetical protein